MKPSIIKICCLFVLTVSCKTLNFDETSKTKTTQQITLGSIGADKDFLLQQDFNNAAIPKYTKPIKLAVNIKAFTKKSFKNFNKAKTLQSALVNMSYIDSIPNKPKYIEFEIADKVSLINAFNAKSNQDIKSYLNHNPKANVITSVSIALNENDLKNVINADAVFLVKEAYKTYMLQLYQSNKKTGIINFNQGVVFGYKTVNCCWQENNKHQLTIVDLVTTFNNCPNKTYRSANRAKKKVNYYKL